MCLWMVRLQAEQREVGRHGDPAALLSLEKGPHVHVQLGLSPMPVRGPPCSPPEWMLCLCRRSKWWKLWLLRLVGAVLGGTGEGRYMHFSKGIVNDGPGKVWMECREDGSYRTGEGCVVVRAFWFGNGDARCF